MNKPLRLLAGLGLASIAFYALAQVRVVGTHASGNDQGERAVVVGTRGGSAGGPPQAMMASIRQSPAVMAMRIEVLGKINTLRMRAKANGLADRAQTLLEVGCWSGLASMTPDQQEYEKTFVWQLGKFKPNGEWDHVASAPSMVSELLKVTDEVNRKIEGISSRWTVYRMRPYDEASKKLAKRHNARSQAFRDAYDGVLKQIHYRLAAEFTGKSAQGMTHDEVLAILAERTQASKEKERKEVRALLTPKQLAEWDRYADVCLSMAERAWKGDPAFPPK